MVSEKSILTSNKNNTKNTSKRQSQVLINKIEDKNIKIDNIIHNLDLNEDELDDFEIIEEPPKQEEFDSMFIYK